MKLVSTLLLLFLFPAINNVVLAQPGHVEDSLSKLIARLPDNKIAPVLYELGNAYYLHGMNDSAFYFASQSREKAIRYANHKLECEAAILAAKCKMHMQKFDEAIVILFECIRVAEKESLVQADANAKNLVGIIYDLQGKEAEALKISYIAEKEFLSIKDTDGLLSLYPEIVTCLGKNRDTAKAMGYFLECLRLFSLYEKSTSISPADLDHLPLKKIALIFNGINVMQNEPDLLAALTEVEKIDKIIAGTDNEYAKFETAVLYAVVNLKLKRFKEAKSYAEKSIGFIRPESGNYDQLADLYHIISDAADSLGLYKEAYSALSLYKQYNDSIFKINSLEAIHSVEAKYDAEKKEARITALGKEKRSQMILFILAATALLVVVGLLVFVLRSKRLKEKLLLRDKEAERLQLEQKMFELEQTALRAQMNPHFIFNSLNSVQRYIINNDFKGVNNYLSTFASLIRQTLENSGKQLLSLKDEIKYLETYISLEKMRGGDTFEYEISVEDGIDMSDMYLPGMIIQPFVENSILYGMAKQAPDKGLLKLTVKKGEKLTVIVEDNGPGIQKEVRLRSVSGDNHEPMGGSITARRITMYNSLHEEKIEFSIFNKSEAGTGESGTRVQFTFPVISD